MSNKKIIFLIFFVVVIILFFSFIYFKKSFAQSALTQIKFLTTTSFNCNSATNGTIFLDSNGKLNLCFNSTTNIVGENYWGLSGNFIYPLSTNYLLSVGSTSVASGYNFQVSGNAWITNILAVGNGGSNLYVSGGNVGIGTTNPSYKLHVEGTGYFSQPVVVGTPTAASHAATKSYVDSMFSGSGPWTLSGSNVYVTNTNNNVGIGTTTPSQRLEVYNGNIRINGGSLFLADVINQTPTQIFSYSNASSLWFVQPVTSPQLVLADAASWDRSVSITYIPGTTGGSSGILRIGQQFKNSTNYTHGITSFFTNGVEQVRINSSGNVGIGTINPTQKLHVEGNTYISGNVGIGTTGTKSKN